VKYSITLPEEFTRADAEIIARMASTWMTVGKETAMPGDNFGDFDSISEWELYHPAKAEQVTHDWSDIYRDGRKAFAHLHEDVYRFSANVWRMPDGTFQDGEDNMFRADGTYEPYDEELTPHNPQH
jgi:hypothetical protein